MDEKVVTVLTVFILGLGLIGCAGQTAPNLRPVEAEQIENVVEQFVMRDTNIPEFDVDIEQVNGSWARVSLKPEGVKSDEQSYLYLQKQTGDNAAPTAATTVQAGHESRVETSTGWTIILGPKVEFTESELDAAGVPQEIRPSS
jgi:hypothetical protein